MIIREYLCSKDLGFNTWALLFQARDAAFRVRGKELSKYGITPEQATVLSIVNDLRMLNLKTTPGQVSKHLIREPHSVSKILSRMEKEGLVKKIRGSGVKRNEVNIDLTEKGKEALDRTLERESINKIMSCLTQEESLQFAQTLEKIIIRALTELQEEKHGLTPIINEK